MVYKVAEEVRKEVGKVDILVNNAGIVAGKPFLELRQRFTKKFPSQRSFYKKSILMNFLSLVMKQHKEH
jgi:NAD(P)-dependent dehydrogenase (short-subunit alcohol dehydrogenase family)